MAQRENSAVPASGLAVVVALLFGYLALHETTLERYRPPKTEKSSDQLIDLQDADARLWQDPFAAVQRHDEELQKVLTSTPRNEWAKRHVARHRFMALNKEISDALKESPVTILGVTVSSAPYPEDVERRQRYRYATLAGLNRASFTPENGDHLGYVTTRAVEGPADCKRRLDLLPDKIPYEWFSVAGTERPAETGKNGALVQRRVLLMWLSESTLGKRPVASLRVLSSCLGFSKPRPDLSIDMLGPMSSDTLRKIVSDNAHPENAWAGEPLVRIYSPVATASDKALLEGLSNGVHIPTCQPPGGAGGSFVCVVRTSVSDEKLAESIVLELERRGVRLHPDCIAAGDSKCSHDRVALISEWDTFYGRSLPDAIGRVLCPRSPRECDAVIRKSYLQGMDGSLPGENVRQPETNGASPKSEQKDITKETARGERADGRYQFDYLRRLTDDMKQQNYALGGGEIKAIGILGSDVYDKLLVLQALRSEFPQAQFFTTDVDARLLHPQEFKWARNIVVASGFGLQLRPELQGDIPPFRDAYQTALFLSTMAAVAPGAHAHVPDQKQLDEHKLLPRLFETGRSHAYALDRDRPNGQCSRYKPLECESLHPDPPEFLPAAVREGWIYIPATLLVVVVGLAFYARAGARSATEPATPGAPGDSSVRGGTNGRIRLDEALALLRQRRAKTVRGFAIAAILLLPLMHIAIAVLLNSDDNAEPLAFYEGISVWPTEALRIYAGLLALFLSYWAMLRMQTNQIELTGTFFPECRQKGIRKTELSCRGFLKGVLGNFSRRKLKRVFACDLLEGQSVTGLCARKFWRHYVFHSSPPVSAIRTTVASVLFVLFAFSLMCMFGFPHTPYRGTASLTVDHFAVLLWSSPLLLFLTFYVVDATLVCKRFVAALGERHTTWSDETRSRYGAVCASSTDLETKQAYDDWIDIRLIGERTAVINSLIYYPLYVMIVLLFARSTLFDQWHWPVGLVVPLLVSVLILFACTIALRRQAEAARANALAQVSERLLVVAGRGAPAAALQAQLKLMQENIEQTRDGAYAPMTQQPLVKALLVFISASGLAILEYFGVISF